MPKKETGVPNLDKYLGERQRTLCNYEQGARMYGVPYYTFVNLCKEAGASFKVKRTAIVDLDKDDLSGKTYFTITNGGKALINKKKFEQYLDSVTAI